MSREHDVQLLESVAVRRNRLRESFLWGRERRVRATTDNLARLAAGVVLAAALVVVARLLDRLAAAAPSLW